MWNQQSPPYWASHEAHYRPVFHRNPHSYSHRPYSYDRQPFVRQQNLMPPFANYGLRPGILETPLHDQKLYMDFSGPSKLDVSYKVNSVAAEVSWIQPTLLGQNYEYQVRVSGRTSRVLEVPHWKTSIRLQIVPGTWYEVTVKALAPKGTILSQGHVKFKAVLSRSEMLLLYQKAVCFVGTDMHRFEMFYRNKPKEYWQKMRAADGFIMRTYLKDNNGHPASPINNEINGLFFTSNKVNGEIPLTSIYGDVRLYMPAYRLLNPDHNLYFCDFYCNYSVHYVTVVITLRGSKTDRYCQKMLIQLNPCDNVFLCSRPNAMVECGFDYWSSSNIWVESFYTEDVDTRFGFLRQVIGRGQSNPNGLPNNKYCTICNLYPKILTDEERAQMAKGPKAIDAQSKKRRNTDSPTQLRKEPASNDGPEAKRRKALETFTDPVRVSSTFELIKRLLSSDELTDPIVGDVFSVLCQIVDVAVQSCGDEPITFDSFNEPSVSSHTDARRRRLTSGGDTSPPQSPSRDKTVEQLGNVDPVAALLLEVLPVVCKPGMQETESKANSTQLTQEYSTSASSNSLASTAFLVDPSVNVTLQDNEPSISNNCSQSSSIVGPDPNIKTSVPDAIGDSYPYVSPAASSDQIDYVDQDKGEFSDVPQVSLRTVAEIVDSLDDPFEREILGLGPSASKCSDIEDVDSSTEEWILTGEIPTFPGFKSVVHADKQPENAMQAPKTLPHTAAPPVVDLIDNPKASTVEKKTSPLIPLLSTKTVITTASDLHNNAGPATSTAARKGFFSPPTPAALVPKVEASSMANNSQTVESAVGSSVSNCGAAVSPVSSTGSPVNKISASAGGIIKASTTIQSGRFFLIEKTSPIKTLPARNSFPPPIPAKRASSSTQSAGASMTWDMRNVANCSLPIGRSSGQTRQMSSSILGDFGSGTGDSRFLNLLPSRPNLIVLTSSSSESEVGAASKADQKQ